MTTDVNRTFSGNISRERQKETGEIFTPPTLVGEMLDKAKEINPDAFKLRTTYFEPAAGDGNFLEIILITKVGKRGGCSTTARLAASTAFLEALRNLYFCEYMLDNCQAIITRIKKLGEDYGVKDMRCISNILRARGAYCNTVDPWDTTEGRRWPRWLFERTPDEQINYMWRKSKHVRNIENFQTLTIPDQKHKEMLLEMIDIAKQFN